MLFHYKNLFDFEKKSVFLINFILIIFVIITFHYGLSLKYFFYINIIGTFIIGYFFFKKSKELAKTLIITNMFIFFYFLYPYVATFLSSIIEAKTYLFIILYNVVCAYIFLLISGYDKKFIGNLSKFKPTIFFSIILLGLSFGLFFTLLKEPIPKMFEIVDTNIISSLMFITFSSLMIAISEQIIFSGFIFNSYRKLTTKFDAFYQTGILFLLFHLLRFEVLVIEYYKQFNDFFLIYIISYYVLLFIFMIVALYLYSFKTKKAEGNFFYPVALHFGADFGLFIFYFLNI